MSKTIPIVHESARKMKKMMKMRIWDASQRESRLWNSVRVKPTSFRRIIWVHRLKWLFQLQVLRAHQGIPGRWREAMCNRSKSMRRNLGNTRLRKNMQKWTERDATNQRNNPQLAKKKTRMMTQRSSPKNAPALK